MSEQPARANYSFKAPPSIERPYGASTPQVEPTSQKIINFFNPSARSFTPGNSIGFIGKIMPAFDFSIQPFDTSFKDNYGSYRQGEEDHISRFFLEAPCHTFFGNGKYKFFSPLIYYTGALAEPDSFERPVKRDPIDDIYDYVKKHAYERYGDLLKYTDGKSYHLKKSEKRLFVNAYGRKTNESAYFNTIIDISALAKMDLIDKLDILRPDGVDVFDPDFPYYLFGDVTNPERGALFHTQRVSKVLNGKTYSFNSLVFNKDDAPDSIEGMRSYDTRPFLNQRVNIWTTDTSDNPMIVLDYQEIVNLIISDGFIPIELVKEACSDFANTGNTTRAPLPERERVPQSMPAPPVNHRSEPPREPAPPPPPARPAPPPPTPTPPPPPPPRPAPVVNELSYYCSVPGVADVVLYPESKIQSLLDSGLEVSVNKDGRWLATEDLDVIGFRLPKKGAPLPPPPPAPPPPKPQEYGVPTDGYVPPTINPAPAQSREPAPAKEPDTSQSAPTRKQEVDPNLTENQLRILREGWAIYKAEGESALTASSSYPVNDLVEFLSLMETYDENGLFKADKPF